METAENKSGSDDHRDAAIAATADAISRLVIEVTWEFDDLSERSFRRWTTTICRVAQALVPLSRACRLLADARLKRAEQHKKQAKEQLEKARQALKQWQAKNQSRPSTT